MAFTTGHEEQCPQEQLQVKDKNDGTLHEAENVVSSAVFPPLASWKQSADASHEDLKEWGRFIPCSHVVTIRDGEAKEPSSHQCRKAPHSTDQVISP